MRNSLFITTIICLFCFLGCSSEDETTEDKKTTLLEGVWFKENNQSTTKLTFVSNKFKIESGAVTLNGTFQIVDNSITGTLKGLQGSNNSVVSPVNFKGEFKLEDTKVTFSKFNEKWGIFFSSWYQKAIK